MIASDKSQCVLVLKISVLSLKRVSVRTRPFVPIYSNVSAMVSSTSFETKCSTESSVKQIRAFTSLEKSWTSSKTFEPLLMKLRS